MLDFIQIKNLCSAKCLAKGWKDMQETEKNTYPTKDWYLDYKRILKLTCKKISQPENEPKK